MTTLRRIGFITLAASLLSACTPKQHQPITTGISFITQAPEYLLAASNDQVSREGKPQKYVSRKTEHWLNHQYRVAARKAVDNNAAYIAFYSDQQYDKPILTPAFSYVTAISDLTVDPSNNERNNRLELGTAANHAVLASNIDFGTAQVGSNLYAYNPNKARADAFEQQESNESITYLSLIRQTHSGQDAPLAHDLALLAHSVDRLATQGNNKIVLLNQYDAQYNTLITNHIKGLDVIISAGTSSYIEMNNYTCLATFEQTQENWQTLFMTFDSKGKIIQCQF
ncbi:hypothetical protein [Photobacterium lutimaris]|uniref:Lipoprotein n=1 Tax=Photobacterium lutimaris TaxID=388278 RepID=A0A2T3J1S6_9GAMM|nr:hypothetical protein [Photobacterium lutimaris]PSU35032.1 hypothetical protein C9I99_08170 [Photobacterium lutimaris]TDR77389.1 hypothetical protein DFP78_102408 [Photobacterium lutimaris]